MRRTVIFVTWDGPQTNYLESLFLPIFVELVSKGFQFRVLQLSWAAADSVSKLRKKCEELGIGYVHVPVLRSPRGLGQVLSALLGAIRLRRELRESSKSIVLFRSIMGALVVSLSRVSAAHQLIYDSDGLPIEERLEFANLRQNGTIHRLLVSIENWALKRASAVLARSEFGRQVLANRATRVASNATIYIVSNGRVRRGRHSLPSARARDVDQSKPLSICYVGSWGEPYDPIRVLNLVRSLRGLFPGATFQIFTGDSSRVSADLETLGLAAVDWISVSWCEVDHLPKALLGFDVGLALRSTTGSTRATSPMKLGAYLASGIAIIGDPIGDEATCLADNNVMFLLKDCPLEELSAWIHESVISDRASRFERCQELAVETFSITESVEQYESVLSL